MRDVDLLYYDVMLSKLSAEDNRSFTCIYLICTPTEAGIVTVLVLKVFFK